MCSRRALLVVAAVVGAVLAAAPAHAYIDPGTTGLVLGWGATLLAWLLVAAAAIRWRLRVVGAAVLRFARARPKTTLLAALPVIVGGAVASLRAFEEGTPTMSAAKSPGRVVLIGLDGADPRMIRALVDEGRLPTIAKIAQQGALAPLAIPNPPQSPVVWASLATGQNPGRHGVFDFIGRDAKKYLPSLALLARKPGGYEYPIRSEAFWDVASAHDVPTTIVRWPMTFPPKDLRGGRVLPGLGVPDVRGGLGRYTYYTDRAPPADEEGRDKVTVVTLRDGVVETTLAGPQTRGLTGAKDVVVPLRVEVAEDGESAVARIGDQSIALQRGRFSRHVDVTFPSGLFGKHVGQIKLLLKSGRAPFALFVTAVELSPDAPVVPFTHPTTYAAELKAAIGPYHTLGMPEDTKALGEGRIDEEDFLAMCRDVEEERRRMLLFELSRFERGVLAFVFDTSDRIQHMTRGDGPAAETAIGRYLIEFDAFLATVLQRMPADTPLILFSDHGFTSFDHAVDLNRWLVDEGFMVLDEAAYAARAPGSAGELFRYVDWSRTRAYAVGFAGVYVNVAGREGKGVVPPAERDAVVAAIQARLAALVDAGGAPVVHRAYRREDLYSGAHQDAAPDVVVGYRPGFRGSWQSAVGGVAQRAIAPNEKRWQRDHIVDASFVPGVLLTSFPLAVEAPHAYDLAPTVLQFLALPIPASMEGRPLQGAVGGAVAARRRPALEVAR